MDEMAAPYDAIAEWYDRYLSGPIYQEIVLPSLLEMTADVRGERILDLACGQGWIARELARRGATVVGVDVSRRQLAIAHEYEQSQPLGIIYIHDDAQTLAQLGTRKFGGVICAMSLMDIPDVPAAFHAAHRVLRRGGWLVAGITHPCFQTPLSEWVTREDGGIARAVSGYFTEGFWQARNRQGIRGQVGARHRTLSTYLNALADAGFYLEHMLEPQASGQRAEQVPGDREVPSSLFLRARAV